MRVLTRPNLGGPTRQAIALWHEHREAGVPTLLVTGAVEAGAEVELSPATIRYSQPVSSNTGGSRCLPLLPKRWSRPGALLRWRFWTSKRNPPS